MWIYILKLCAYTHTHTHIVFQVEWCWFLSRVQQTQFIPTIHIFIYFTVSKVLLLLFFRYIFSQFCDAYTFMVVILTESNIIIVIICWTNIQNGFNVWFIKEKRRRKIRKWDIIQFLVNLTDRWMDEWPNKQLNKKKCVYTIQSMWREKPSILI